MQPTADLATFRAGPVGRALLGSTWIHFCAHARLFGIILWGRPGAEDIAGLVRSLKVELEPGILPHSSLVDASRLESVDSGAFEALNAYVTAHADPLSRAVTRLALVRPSGMAGALAAGFYEVLERPYPVEVFAEAAAGLEWLGEPAEVGASLDRLLSQIDGISAFLGRLRALLDTEHRDATLPSVARRLAVSDRTLQRRLRVDGTTFAAELLAARLRAACRQMLDSDAPLTAIAYATGFSSPQHLSTAFRKAYGEQPSTWRRQRR